MATILSAAGAATPLLDRVDGTVAPSGTLPGSVATAGATPVTRFIERPGGRIAYDLTGGTGPLVICVPSLGDLRQEYRFLVPQLAAAGFRVATMDLRGHGESSIGWADYSAAAVGADIVALAHALGDGPTYIIGTSMAAGAAVWAAADAPELFAGQILIGPFVRSATVGSKPSKAQELLIKVLFAGPWGAPSWGLYYRSLYKGARPADLAAYRGALKANLREPGRMDALRAMLAAKNDNSDRLGAVRGRSLVVMGTADPDFPDPAGEARWLAAQLGGAPLLVDGTGHYPHAERPDEVGRAIVEWLRGQ